MVYKIWLNAKHYIDIIKNILLPFIAANFYLRQGQWFFQQDNAPCHMAKLATS